MCDSVFDVFRAKLLVEILFWNITASCTTMYAAHDTKMRPDDFSDATNAILPSCTSLQPPDINIVHLLLWLWRKQQIRDKGTTETGYVVWQTSYYLCWLLYTGDWSLHHPLRRGFTLISGSMKLTPHLHAAKHLLERTCVLIYRVSTGRGHFSLNKISEYQLNMTEAISEDSVFNDPNYPIIHQLWPSNQTSMSSSRTWSSVSTAAQLGRSIKIGGSQSNLRNQRKAALKTP